MLFCFCFVVVPVIEGEFAKETWKELVGSRAENHNQKS